jgi:hypothetical protein
MEIFSFLSFWPEGLLLPPSAFGPRSSSRWPARLPQPAVHQPSKPAALSCPRAAYWAGPAEAAGRLAPAASPFSLSPCHCHAGPTCKRFLLPLLVTEVDSTVESDAAPALRLPCTARRALS